MKYKHLLTTLALLAFSQMNASDFIDPDEDSEEKSAHFTVPDDLQATLDGMKKAMQTQSFQNYRASLLTYMSLANKYKMSSDTANALMWRNLSPLFKNH